MALHIETGTAAPATAPSNVGDHFVNTTSGRHYVSVGTSTSADWKETALVEQGQDYLKVKVLGTSTYIKVYAVTDADGNYSLQLIP